MVATIDGIRRVEGEATLPAKADMTQPELSRLERASDVRLSTLRRYVKAMGGEIEVIAVVKGKRIALHGV